MSYVEKKRQLTDFQDEWALRFYNRFFDAILDPISSTQAAVQWWRPGFLEIETIPSWLGEFDAEHSSPYVLPGSSPSKHAAATTCSSDWVCRLLGCSDKFVGRHLLPGARVEE